MNKITLIIVLFLGFYATNTKALNLSVNDTIDIEEVVITGTKTKVNRNQIPLTISIINSKIIEESAESALSPILSKHVPGLFITERGVNGFGVAKGSAGQISIRGIGGNPTTEVLILLNGNPQYMGIMGHSLADAYRSANIERVEVIRGPASTLYGSNAMGGVINIITKEQKTEGFSINGQLAYGSFNSQKYSLGTGFKKNKFSIYTGINHDRTDGHREASFFYNTDGYIKTKYSINKHFKVLGDFSLTKFNGADPGLDTADIIIHGDTLDILRGMGAIVLNNNFKTINGSVHLFYNFGKHNITSGFLSDDFNYGIIAYENFNLFKNNTITLGLDYKIYGGKADLTKFKGGVTIVDTAMNELAGYITMQQKLFSKLTLNAGIRIDKHSVFGTELVPTGGLAYHILKNTNIKASVSKGFRSPTIRELFIQFPFAPAPNPNLQPENIINSEFSIQQKLLNKKLNIELCIFNINGDNLITVKKDNTGKPTFFNTKNVNNSGVEIMIEQYINQWWSINTNYSFINMDKPVTGTPKHKFYISNLLSVNKFSADLSCQYIKDLIITEQEKETYTLLNLRLAYKIHKTTNIYIKADNILNQNYVINYGYPMPGITIMAGVNFHFNR